MGVPSEYAYGDKHGPIFLIKTKKCKNKEFKKKKKKKKKKKVIGIATAASSAYSHPQSNNGVGTYHWRELPQVSFLSRQNTSFVMTKVCLLRQNLWRDKTFVATNIFLS